MKFQQTVAAELTITGQALFSGAPVVMKILPQPTDTGVWFLRSDLPGRPKIKAEVGSVIDTLKNVTIGRDGWKISTIEHLMAAFHGLGVDNVLVEVDGPELPRGDCSGLFFANQLLSVGLTQQDRPRRLIRIQEPLWVEGLVYKKGQPSKAMIIALPSEHDYLEITFTFTSDHAATGTQFFYYKLDETTFMQEIAPARTIAFAKDLEYQRSQGRELTEDDLNCVVIVGDDSYQNELRLPDEIVRHKILDIIGDLYLTGPLAGQIIAFRSGHTLDLEIAKKISGALMRV